MTQVHLNGCSDDLGGNMERRLDAVIAEDQYPGHVHPSFDRKTLSSLYKSINIVYDLTCMKWFLHSHIKRKVFLVFCPLHKCLATVLVEIVLYFPCALAPFHFFFFFWRILVAVCI